MAQKIFSPFIFILKCIEFIIFSIIFGIAFIFILPFIICKVKGKKNIQKDDEGRVLLANHYELFGPMALKINSPLKYRSWTIDKMMDKNLIEKQMGLMIYANYKHCPRFIKTIFLKISKRFILYVMRINNGIKVSRENIRTNILSIEESINTIEKNKAVAVFPEYSYKKEGVGEFQTGFMHIAKKYYDKTGKCLTYYPIFISYKKRTLFIGKPHKYNPKMNNEEKDIFVNEIRNEMIKMYENAETKKVG